MFKSRPKFDEGIFESYVHLNLVVLVLSKCQNKWQNFSSFASFSENLKFIEKGGATKIIIAWVSDLV